LTSIALVFAPFRAFGADGPAAQDATPPNVAPAPAPRPVAASTSNDSGLGQDEVTLKNGGTIRGTLVSVEPGVGVKIIELGGSAPREIPWAQVADVDRGKFAPKGAGQAASPTAMPRLPLPPPQMAPVERVMEAPVRLHVESPVPATVQSHEVVARYGWAALTRDRDVCTSPCDAVLDSSSGLTYTVSGDFTGSPSFSLAGRHGDVEVAVSPGSRGARAGGIVLTALGGAGALVGGLVAIAGADQDTARNPSGSGTETAGFVAVGVGVAVALVGVVTIVTARTTIDVRTQGEKSARAPRYWAGEF
jgi:hypothetical protein